MSDYTSLGDAIQAYLDAQGMRGDYEAQRAIEAWPSLMGAPVAASTDTVWYEAKTRTFYVRMKSAAWRNELMHARTKIQELLNRRASKPFVDHVVIC